MKRRAIFVNAYNRPHYLYVTLDALRRCRDLDQWDVFVDFDGGSDADFRICAGLIDYKAIHRKANLGCMDHPHETLKMALHLRYDYIFYVEDDMICRSDILKYISSQLTHPNHEDSIISCWHHPTGKVEEMAYKSDGPSLFSSKLATDIIQFFESKEWVGMDNICAPGTPIKLGEKYHDVCWWSWTQKRHVMSRFAPVQFSLNFGLSGMNFEYKEHEKDLYTGPKEGWLDAVVSLFSKPEMQWWPRSAGFVYG